MTIKELYETIDNGDVFIVDENLRPLVNTHISTQSFAEYSEEVDEFRKLAEKNKYLVKKIRLLKGDDPCISVELVKVV